MKLYWLYAAILASLSSLTVQAQTSLESVVEEVNSQIDGEGLKILKINKILLHKWFRSALPFVFLKEDRDNLQKHLMNKNLAPGFSIQIQKLGIPNFPDRIVLNPQNATIVSGRELLLYTEFASHVCGDPRVCSEEFSSPLPTSSSTIFPGNVQTRISQYEVQGECLLGRNCERDSLTIELLATPLNKNEIVKYFSVGFSPNKIKENIDFLLGENESKWINLAEILSGWIADKVNTFPVEGDNEVCHGPARQFYNQILFNGTFDRSTEATESLLNRKYCLIDDGEEPAFGDYLYVPGRHSGRFIMKDPDSQRWISFSVYSGGAAPFRFWWSDEDFSGRPFDHQPMPNFREKYVDVWRRCKL